MHKYAELRKTHTKRDVCVFVCAGYCGGMRGAISDPCRLDVCVCLADVLCLNGHDGCFVLHIYTYIYTKTATSVVVRRLDAERTALEANWRDGVEREMHNKRLKCDIH